MLYLTFSTFWQIVALVSSVNLPSAALNTLLLMQPESMDAGDENALEPYEGFSILSIVAVVATVIIVFFVIFKVIQGMNRRSKE